MPEEIILPSQEYRATDPIEEMVALVWARSKEYRTTNAFRVTPELQNWHMVQAAELTRVSREDKELARQLIGELQQHRLNLIEQLPAIDNADAPATATERFAVFAQQTEFATLDLQRVPHGGDVQAANEDLQKLLQYIDDNPSQYLREAVPRDEQNYRMHIADFGGMIAENVLYLCQNNVLQSVLHQEGNYVSYIAERAEYAVNLLGLDAEVLELLCKSLYSFATYSAPKNAGQPDVPQDHAGRLQGETYQTVQHLLNAGNPHLQMVHTTRYIHRDPQAVTTFGDGTRKLPTFNVQPTYLSDQLLGKRSRQRLAV
jgi:hypothetical protein